MYGKVNALDELPKETGGWRLLLLLAGLGTALAIGFSLLDMVLSGSGADSQVGVLSAAQWYEMLRENAFIGLRNLGLFNVINIILTLPLYLAIFWLHQKSDPAISSLALMLFLLGAAVYISNNRSLTLLALSQQYAQATATTQRSLLEAAGTAVLAQSEDFTPGTFYGFLLSNLASVVTMVVILRGRVFPKGFALTGLSGSLLLLMFTPAATFSPHNLSWLMILAAAGGLCMLVWQALTAVRLIGMTRSSKAAFPLNSRQSTSGKFSAG